MICTEIWMLQIYHLQLILLANRHRMIFFVSHGPCGWLGPSRIANGEKIGADANCCNSHLFSSAVRIAKRSVTPSQVLITRIRRKAIVQQCPECICQPRVWSAASSPEPSSHNHANDISRQECRALPRWLPKRTACLKDHPRRAGWPHMEGGDVAS